MAMTTVMRKLRQFKEDALKTKPIQFPMTASCNFYTSTTKRNKNSKVSANKKAYDCLRYWNQG